MKNFWFFSFCFWMAVPGLGQNSSKVDPGLAVVRGLVEAFNEHDVEAMLAFTTEDVVYLSIAGKGISVEAEGHDALGKGMKSYFAAIPSVRSEIEAEMVSGAYVIFRERAFWQTKDGEKSQSALAVYEVREGKVKRVWYYPAEKD